MSKKLVKSMALSEFTDLLHYQTSQPSGVYPGKTWRRCLNDGWHFGEYQTTDDPNMCRVVWTPILIIDGLQPSDGRFYFQKDLPYNPVVIDPDENIAAAVAFRLNGSLAMRETL